MADDATNAVATKVADDDKEVTEDDLRALKYGEDGVEASKETDETDESQETGEESEETETEAETSDETEEQSEESFVKEFPQIKGDTPEEYAKNLEKAYQESTKEALRLKGIADAPKITEEETKDDESRPATPLDMWAQQELDKKITTAYADFSKEYTQVEDPGQYAVFTKRVAVLSKTIFADEGRLAEPSELYSTAALSLGWDKLSTPTSKEKLDMALKDKGATSKPTASGAKSSSKSKVTDAMIKVNRMMYPDKTDAQIREELEPYV